MDSAFSGSCATLLPNGLKDCTDIKAANSSAASGVYTIKISGDTDGLSCIDVYCDMYTDTSMSHFPDVCHELHDLILSKFTISLARQLECIVIPCCLLFFKMSSLSYLLCVFGLTGRKWGAEPKMNTGVYPGTICHAYSSILRE